MKGARILPPGMTFEQALRAGYTGRIDHEGYRKWLKTLPCDVCHKAPPSDPSHVNAYKGAGTKSPIFFAIPECRACHEAYEDDGDPDAEARLARAALYLLRAIYEGRLVWKNI